VSKQLNYYVNPILGCWNLSFCYHMCYCVHCISYGVVNRDARVMWDQRSGRSRGFGFVSFRSQQVGSDYFLDLLS
jgi:hypothetical protein